MIIKKFSSKTESEAVENARKELGPGVVVMSVRQIKKKGFLGIFSSPQVEVTVALEDDNEKPQPKAPTITALEQLAAKQREKNEQRAKAEAQRNRNDEDIWVGTGNEGVVANQSNNREKIVKEDVIVENGPSVSSKENVQKNFENRLRESEKSSALEEKLDSIETLIKRKLENEETKETEEEHEPHNEANEHMKLIKLMYNMMIDNEVYERYANQIIEEAEKTNKPNMPVDYVLGNIYQKMILKFGQTSVISPASQGPKVVFFVGPTGVGKTTTIAKIASKFCLEDKKQVALLTSDTYRIAATEQLKTYANILDIPCDIIYSPTDIQEAYEKYTAMGKDYILVDTAGHSHQNEEQKSNTNVVLHALDGTTEAEVYLVLSATTKYKDLISIADTYREFTDFKIIFTKLDETTSLGNLLNLKLYTGADLSYVTYGQNVPNDIDKFDPQSAVKQILGGGNNHK